jgi:sec-independent protein translocase protein TatA
MFEGILQPTHLLLILLIVLIIFGPGKLPELGKTLGGSIREFRESMSPGAEPARSIAPPADPATPGTRPAPPPTPGR